MKEYYKFYLTLHQHPKCKLLHFLGQWFTIFFASYVIYNWYWFLFPAIPLVVYPFAWVAHGVFEKNKPLAWEGKKDYGWTTLKAKACDWIMFYEIIRGRHRIW
tara:strand:+ start:79 stop:387 length:309 start_codon:yes stop_codon:yes gene_type:complete